MLSFLRKIRKGLLKENHFSKYLLYTIRFQNCTIVSLENTGEIKLFPTIGGLKNLQKDIEEITKLIHIELN